MGECDKINGFRLRSAGRNERAQRGMRALPAKGGRETENRLAEDRKDLAQKITKVTEEIYLNSARQSVEKSFVIFVAFCVRIFAFFCERLSISSSAIPGSS